MRFKIKKSVSLLLITILCFTGSVLPVFAADGYITEQNDADIADQPSWWAVDGINEAISMNLVPENLRSNYQEPINRLEFMKMVFSYLEYKVNKAYHLTVEEFLKSLGYRDNVFSDINDHDLNLMYSFGAVKGYEDGTFRPYRNVTRQEACCMLLRPIKPFTSAVMPSHSVHRASNRFKDYDSEVSEWAKEQVAIITGFKFMNGVGEGIFAPKQNLTREQAILIILRVVKMT